ncbi:hypothetical protein [Delftia acidovorans]|uniref:hypothetical protein n=1 Tax=Delftia acidovorans TaxID=80866 RepID=UPI001EDFFCE7|nr:hypothetical protein [Delftia acidovorans]MCG3782742.1 hypothetical protein [Delftia acidovorans]
MGEAQKEESLHGAGWLWFVAPGLPAEHFFNASLMDAKPFGERCVAQVVLDVRLEAVALACCRSDLRNIQRHELGLRELQAAPDELGAALLPFVTVDAVP